MALYFFLSAVETIFIGLYLISVGSDQNNQVIFSLSGQRLILVAFVGLITLLFIYLFFVALRERKKQEGFLDTLLKNKKKTLLLIIFCLLLSLVIFYFLTRKPSFWGHYKLISDNMRPVLCWILGLSLQTAIFMFIWFCTYFINNREQESIKNTKQELLPIFILYLLALIIKWFIVSSASYGPTGIGDEMTYYDMADSLQRGFFSIKQTYHYPPLYPLILMPALSFGQYTFTIIKLINAIISTSIIFPTYLISRTFMNEKKSLIPALLACFLPYHLIFPRRIVSENLYFSIFLWTFFLILKKPSHRTTALIWDIITGFSLGLLYLTRYISFAAIPMFLIAWWLKPFDKNDQLFKPSTRKFLRFVLISLISFLTFSPWVIRAIMESLPIKLALGFGITSKTNQDQLTLINLLLWIYLYSSYIILIAAPMLPLLLKSITLINWKEWREEYGRFIAEILLVLMGFLAAASRHSWRAYYNEHMPLNIMGRYVLYFSVPFIILATTTLKKSQSNKKQNKVNKNDPILWIVSLLLVILAYQTIVKGNIVSIGNYFLRPNGSVDAYYLKIMGKPLFILIPLLYCLYFAYLNGFAKRGICTIILVVQIFFYVVGWPNYYNSLKAEQTYPYLSSKVSELARQLYPKEDLTNKISLYIPSSLEGKAESEFYNGLRVRGIDNTIIIKNTELNITNIPTKYGFIIDEVFNKNLADDLAIDFSRADFYGKEFLIRPINK
ncbi:MAG: hypothetical protein PWQ55_2481 [Chloroflexota bacterium]|nr:hypothetical protein [Chloroflexota bacterium]